MMETALGKEYERRRGHVAGFMADCVMVLFDDDAFSRRIPYDIAPEELIQCWPGDRVEMDVLDAMDGGIEAVRSVELVDSDLVWSPDDLDGHDAVCLSE